MNIRRFLHCAIFLSILLSAPFKAQCSTARYDLVVYGGTASGVATAIAAARHGLHVILLEPGNHIGGMVTGGLSATDIGNTNVIGGIAREFFERTARVYHIEKLAHASDWKFEPHVAERVFTEMLREAGVEVHFHEQLLGLHGVRVQNHRVVSISSTDGRTWHAALFADCSYEGDLMAQAGVDYTWGRESAKQYNENLAGVRQTTPKHQFTFPVSAFDVNGKLLPEIDPGPLAEAGIADRKVQAYNFRVILSRDAKNQIPFPRPDRYDPHQFELLAKYLEGFQHTYGRNPRLSDVTMPTPIPGNKADFNNWGPISTDYIGKSWLYPNASYSEREKIWNDHLSYTEGFFYFLANDPRVPTALQHEVKTWGLPKDEFVDTGHWPFQLYIREGRRMIGEYVMRQSDMQTDRTKPDSIGMGSYNSDSHNVQRIATTDGYAKNEGDVQVPVSPYQIPYRSIVPKRAQIQNLFVPVCLSASHVAYSSLRMEPQYMIIGQAAGEGAALALRKHVGVQDVDIASLQRMLSADSVVLHISY